MPHFTVHYRVYVDRTCEIEAETADEAVNKADADGDEGDWQDYEVNQELDFVEQTGD